MDATKESEARAVEPLRVSIFNQPYHLRTDGDGDYVRELARFVDERMQAISAHTSIVDYAKVAVLAALNIADELHRLKLEAQGEPATDDALPPVAKASEAARPAADSGASPDRGAEGDSWSYSDIFEALPSRESLPKLGQNITTRLRQLREESGPASQSEKDE
jgi:cell division protein ZapA